VFCTTLSDDIRRRIDFPRDDDDDDLVSIL
jgi:hypothetical protein